MEDQKTHFYDMPDLPMVTLVGSGRSGTKFLQSHFDGHPQILMIPGYPLLYFYPHFDSWCKQFADNLSWDILIDLFCEKHASVLDSRKVLGLSGLERLGTERDEHIEIDEAVFRHRLHVLLENIAISSRVFLLAVHFAYAFCKGWDLNSKRILFYHVHEPSYVPRLVQDFPELKLMYMIRNPVPCYHAGLSAHVVSDEIKLNLTDAMRFRGRSFLNLTRSQFNTIPHLLNQECLDQSQVRSIKLEDGYKNLKEIMRDLSKWLSIDYSETLLRISFDNKSWWGDYATTTNQEGFNKEVISDKWTGSISRRDQFVIEGIRYYFYKFYNYPLTLYKSDTLLNRISLFLKIFVLTKMEMEILRYYLNPRTHYLFLSGAFNESNWRIVRKDYGWNATYLHKWTYIDLQLWRKRWHETLLDQAELLLEGSGSNSFIRVRLIVPFARLIYVSVNYLRFWMALLTFPVNIIKRWGIYYRALWRRFEGHVFLPSLLGKK